MKKATGILFLLLANLALLAHTVIPHHHPDSHQLSICDLLPAEDASNSHCAHHDMDGQEHGANGLGDECILNGLYIRVASGHHSSLGEDYPSYDTTDNYPSFCAIVNPSAVRWEEDGRPFRHRPFLHSCYTRHIAASSGLRAPPVC
jgi:hypothetical protein